jgi:hypothetical protein
MKKLIIFVLVVSGILSGCAETEQPAKQTSLAVGKDAYEYLNTDEKGTIPVVCNINWFATSDQSWCKAVRAGDNVVLTMEKNTTVFKRTAKIMVSTSIGGLKRPVTVIQNGDVPTLIVDPSEYNFKDLGGEATLKVTSNLAWKASSDSKTWCTVTKVGDGVKIVVNSTAQTTPRQAKITISGEVSGIEKVVLINQEAAAFGVDKSNFEFAIGAVSEEANITASSPWSFTVSASWISAVKDNNKLKISVPANNGPERTGEIIITAGTASATLYIKQAGLAGLELDRQALIALYNSLNGAAWSGVKWNIDKPLLLGANSTDWNGVTVTSVAGVNRVTNINLSDRKLVGNIPSEIGYLTEILSINLNLINNTDGALPVSIGSLTKLQTLIMSRSKLTQIPDVVFTLKALKTLNFQSSTTLTGSIPEGLANLTGLTTLELQNCNFTGSIPSGIFGKLTLLNSLKLNANKLKGEIPEDMKSNLKWSSWTAATNICPQQTTFGFTNCP